MDEDDKAEVQPNKKRKTTGISETKKIYPVSITFH